VDEGRFQVNSQTAQVDDLQLVAVPSAVNLAELFVRFTLTEWSLRSLLDDAMHVARQLVTAVVDSTDSGSPGLITVRLRVRGNSLVIEVEDDQIAQLRAGSTTVAGRRAGVVPLEGRGKLVWCELPLPSDVDASAVPLPRRERRRSPAAAQMADEPHDVDPEVMQRLLFGLSRPPDEQAE
jgi:hypothetical protein